MSLFSPDTWHLFWLPEKSLCHFSIFHLVNRGEEVDFAESWHYKALHASVSARCGKAEWAWEIARLWPCCSVGTAHWVCRYGAESEKWLQSFTAGQLFSLTPYYLFIVMHPCPVFKHHLLLTSPMYTLPSLSTWVSRTSYVTHLPPSYFSLNIWKYSVCVSERAYFLCPPLAGWLAGCACKVWADLGPDMAENSMTDGLLDRENMGSWLRSSKVWHQSTKLGMLWVFPPSIAIYSH